MKRLVLLALIFISLSSVASESYQDLMLKGITSIKKDDVKIGFNLGKFQEEDMRNVEVMLDKIAVTDLPTENSCTITITLEFSMGIFKATGSASATATTCKEAAAIAAKGAKEALVAASWVIK